MLIPVQVWGQPGGRAGHKAGDIQERAHTDTHTYSVCFKDTALIHL